MKDSPGENILEVLDETSDWIEKVLKVMIKVMLSTFSLTRC